MKIAFNALVLRERPAGVAGAVWNLLRALRKVDEENEYVVYAGRRFPKEYDEKKIAGERWSLRRTIFPASWRAWRVLWEEACLARRAVRDGAELIHCPAYVAPKITLGPSVATIYDAIVLRRPELCWRGSLRRLRKVIPRTSGSATRIIVPSAATKRDLVELAAAPAEKIKIVPLGVDHELFRPLTDRATLAAARQALSLPERYLLFVGIREPKKNLPALVRAFFAATAANQLPHALVITGSRGWGGVDAKLAREVRAHGMKGRVFITGYVPDAALPFLYNLADALLFPSLIEGFGLPVLEALACGTPVLISRDPALLETAGGAALEAEATDLKSLREGIEKILLDRKLRRELREKGLARAKEFSWERTARETIAVWREALEEWKGEAPKAAAAE